MKATMIDSADIKPGCINHMDMMVNGESEGTIKSNTESHINQIWGI
jgi:hypothetical protein